MNPPPIRRIRNALDAMYIAPIRDPGRRAAYGSVFFLMFSGFFLELYYAFSQAEGDLAELFLLLWAFHASCAVLVSICVLLIIKLPRRITIPLSLAYPSLILTAAALLEMPALTGFAIGSSVGIGWAWNHLVLKSSTTEEARSAQIAAGIIAGMAGNLAATACAGITASLTSSNAPLVIAIAALTAAIAMTIARIKSIPLAQKKQPVILPTLCLLVRNPARLARTAVNGTVPMLCGGVAAVWLRLNGISPQGSSALIILGTIGMLCLNGFVGRLNDKSRLNGYRLSGSSLAAAWIPWLLGIPGIGAVVSPALWSISQASAKIGNKTEWFDEEGLLPLAARDIGHAMGSVPSIAILLFAATNPIELLPFVGMGAATCIAAATFMGLRASQPKASHPTTASKALAPKAANQLSQGAAD